MASKSLGGISKVGVCFTEMSNEVKNKALVNNYTVISCVFRKKATAHYF